VKKEGEYKRWGGRVELYFYQLYNRGVPSMVSYENGGEISTMFAKSRKSGSVGRIAINDFGLKEMEDWYHISKILEKILWR